MEASACLDDGACPEHGEVNGSFKGLDVASESVLVNLNPYLSSFADFFSRLSCI
jgi:hypothetical protein